MSVVSCREVILASKKMDFSVPRCSEVLDLLSWPSVRHFKITGRRTICHDRSLAWHSVTGRTSNRKEKYHHHGQVAGNITKTSVELFIPRHWWSRISISRTWLCHGMCYSSGQGTCPTCLKPRGLRSIKPEPALDDGWKSLESAVDGGVWELAFTLSLWCLCDPGFPNQVQMQLLHDDYILIPMPSYARTHLGWGGWCEGVEGLGAIVFTCTLACDWTLRSQYSRDRRFLLSLFARQCRPFFDIQYLLVAVCDATCICWSRKVCNVFSHPLHHLHAGPWGSSSTQGLRALVASRVCFQGVQDVLGWIHADAKFFRRFPSRFCDLDSSCWCVVCSYGSYKHRSKHVRCNPDVAPHLNSDKLMLLPRRFLSLIKIR